MSVPESILLALFCIVIVFAVLGCLFLLIRLFSLVFGAIENARSQRETASATPEPSVALKAETVYAHDFSAGELKLYDVDEPTAAMIMAIVSDESGIPLSELCFKSIKSVNNQPQSN